jgi:hypothetical protein
LIDTFSYSKSTQQILQLFFDYFWTSESDIWNQHHLCKLLFAKYLRSYFTVPLNLLQKHQNLSYIWFCMSSCVKDLLKLDLELLDNPFKMSLTDIWSITLIPPSKSRPLLLICLSLTSLKSVKPILNTFFLLIESKYFTLSAFPLAKDFALYFTAKSERKLVNTYHNANRIAKNLISPLFCIITKKLIILFIYFLL